MDEYTPFEVLDRISAAYYGKQMFFLQEDGTIYDRSRDKYVTFEEALTWMSKLVGEED